MKILSVLARFSGGRFALALATGIASGLASAALLALINSTLAGEDSVFGYRVLPLFVLLCVLVPLLRFFSAWVLFSMGQKAIFDLRLELSQRILAAPLRRLETLGAHRLLATLTQDIGSIAIALTDIPLLAMNVAMIVGSLVYMGYLSWQVLLVVLAFMVLGILSYQLPTLAGLRQQRLAREEGDQLYGKYRAVTEGTKELKLHRWRRGAFIDQLDSTASRFRKLNVRANAIFAAASSWGQMLFFVVIGGLLFAAPNLVLVNLEILTGFCLVLLYMMNPMQVVLDTIPQLSQASVAMNKVESLGLSLLEDTPARERELAGGGSSANREQPFGDWRELKLVGVEHSFHTDAEEHGFTLGPFDLTLHRGEVLFVIGGNGSGKTTLAKLLLGLYEPEAGAVWIDQSRIDDQNRESYRQLFSAVFSDFYLFPDLLGLSGDELDQRAEAYLVELQLQRKVRIESGRLSTTDLSQGQRKRLALLTAYLEDREIYLFDEWAADQDPLFKEVFYRQILPSLKERSKTVVVISHDDHYFDAADRMLKLEYGQLDLEGSPEQFVIPAAQPEVRV
jgi:putative ATP-binding cassette transporter